MNIESIADAYKVLKLEDPISFQEAKMKNYVKSIRDGDSALHGEMFMKEAFLFMRQTGRTTYKCVDAAIRLLNGTNVMFVCANIRSTKIVEEKIRNYLWTLGLENHINYLDVGKLEVRAASNMERLRIETVGYNGDIIVDIY